MVFTFMGKCGVLVLERFSIALRKPATEKTPLLLLLENQVKQSVMCQ